MICGVSEYWKTPFTSHCSTMSKHEMEENIVIHECDKPRVTLGDITN